MDKQQVLQPLILALLVFVVVKILRSWPGKKVPHSLLLHLATPMWADPVIAIPHLISTTMLILKPTQL